MKDIIIKICLKEILKKRWSIDANEKIDVPRGFVAEPLFDKAKNNEFFVKAIDEKSRYTENILDSLPVIDEMTSKGISNIPYVIKTITHN